MRARLKNLLALLESPRAHQAWRFARVAAAFVVSSGVIDQAVNGTLDRTALAAAATGLIEVLYRAAVPPK